MASNRINLGKSPTKKIFWTYAIPSILAMVAQNTAALVDALFIGRYVGPEGLSAITLIMPILMLLIGIGAMVAVGGTTQASIERGRGNHERSNNFFNITISLLALIGIIAAVAVHFLIPYIADFTGARGVTKDYTITYGRTIAYFAMFFLMNFAFGFYLKVDEKPKLVVSILIGGTVLHILLDFLLIGYLQLSLFGAALSTGISQLLPWLIMLWVIVYRSRWQIRMPHYNLGDLGKMLFNGLSELLSNTSTSIAGMVINIIIMKRIGVEGVAAYAVALQVTGLASSLGYGFAESIQAGVSFNYGAKQYDRVSSLLKMVFKASLITGILLFFIGFFFGETIAAIFVKDPDTVIIAGEILKYYAFAFVFICVNISYGTYYTSVDDPITSGGITFYRSLVALVTGLLVLPLIFGDTGIWLAIIFAEVTTFIVGQVMLRKYPYGLKA